MYSDLTRIRNRKTGRFSSWDTAGRNADMWTIPPNSSLVLADISGPAQITHIWMTQSNLYRECLLKITYDGAPFPSALVPLGDFFCLGHGMVNSFQSEQFSASTQYPYMFNSRCALNCYAPMPFAKRAVVELVNECHEPHYQYFYVDYETLEDFLLILATSMPSSGAQILSAAGVRTSPPTRPKRTYPTRNGRPGRTIMSSSRPKAAGTTFAATCR
jgi:hypothetical protein